MSHAQAKTELHNDREMKEADNLLKVFVMFKCSGRNKRVSTSHKKF